MSTIAFLGLGHMGGPMSANLVAAGHTVHGFDPVAALKDAAAEKGAQVFDSVAEAAAEAEVVITSLPNGDIVKAVYADALPAAAKGTLFIDTSTISVDDARTINKQAADHGHAQLDAPVSGGVKGATAGTLAFMVGGDDAAVERARPILDPMAGKVIHCGGSGTGQFVWMAQQLPVAPVITSNNDCADSPSFSARTNASPAAICCTASTMLLHSLAACPVPEPPQ